MEMRIVVATDATEMASGALHVARALAERHQARVEVLSVLEAHPTHEIVHTETLALAKRQLAEAGCMALQRRLEDHLAAAGPEAAAWPTSVEVGVPAVQIARRAQARGASLIVMGLGRHSVAERWFGTETALRVMRVSPVPVLAVPAEARGLPTCAVAAIDFSDFSLEAARAALHLLAPGGTLHLVHVFWRPSEDVYWVGGSEWIDARRAETRERLRRIAREMDGTGVEVLTHFMEGNPAAETLRLAGAVGAELVAAGSHGSGFFSRLLMGSVSTRLVRRAACMTLVVPPRDAPAELESAREAAGAVAAPAAL